MQNYLSINYFKGIVNKKYFFLLLFTTISLVISLQQILIGQINNFIIFRTALTHLTSHMNLYCGYPNEYHDTFLYNPSFIILFFPFFLLPTYLGLILWVQFICIIYYFTINGVFKKSDQVFIFLFTLIEFVTSTQSLQLNSTLACFMLLTYTLLEKNKPVLASLFVVLGVFIKVYPGLAVLLFIFYPNKLKFVIWGIIWATIAAALPLLVVSPEELISIYNQWFHSLASDNSLTESSKSLSLIGILFSWFSHPLMNTVAFQLIGLGILLVPFSLIKKHKNKVFRLLILVSIMLFVVLFNHASESPTYIIAVIACGIWYLNSRKNYFDKLLLLLVFLFTILLSTDIYPMYLRIHYFVPLSIKAIPVLLVWLKLQYDIYTLKTSIE